MLIGSTSMRQVLISVVIASAFIQISPALEAKPEDQKLLERLILDAQEENRSKITGGEMVYHITGKIGKQEPVVFDATVRWDKTKAFWTYKISGNTTPVTGKRSEPYPKNQAEYALRFKDKLYIYNAYTNCLHDISSGQMNRIPLSPYLDVFPETLGSNCCFPFHSTGRPWAEMTGSNYARLSYKSTVVFERTSKSLIRQTLTDPTGTVATTDFSMEYSGYPIRMEYISSKSKRQNSMCAFDWIKSNGATVLKKFKIVRGDDRLSEKDALEVYEFDARSFRNSNTEVPFDLNALKSLLPKNTTIVDHIQQKSYPLNPKEPASSRISDDALDRLGQEVKKEGFAKP